MSATLAPPNPLKCSEKYAILKRIGAGSFGEVHLVRDETDRQKYVRKMLGLVDVKPRDRDNALQEATLLSRLKHPNIVAYKESYVSPDGSYLFIIMAYCEGGDLYTRLKQQHGVLLGEAQVMQWVVQIALALQYLHDQKVLHRDLKTQNIFIRRQVIKVGDLGIARVLKNESDLATTVCAVLFCRGWLNPILVQMIGTPYYMSPELFSNTPYNHKSDVWSFGCCVYEMATLTQAFNARDMNALAYRVMQGKVADLPDIYSPALNALVKSMLALDPLQRPSAVQLLKLPFIKEHIKNLLAEKSGSSKPTSIASGRSQLPAVMAVSPAVVLHDTSNPDASPTPQRHVMPMHAVSTAPPDHNNDATPVNMRARRQWRARAQGKLPALGSDLPSSPLVHPKILSELSDESRVPPVANDGRLPNRLRGAPLTAGAIVGGAGSAIGDCSSDDAESDSEQAAVAAAELADDNVENWLEDNSDTDDFNGGHIESTGTVAGDEETTVAQTPPRRHLTGVGKKMAGATPLRGPLVQQSERLRRQCLAALGDALFSRALDVLLAPHQEMAEREAKLVSLLKDKFETTIGVLHQLFFCEVSLAAVNGGHVSSAAPKNLVL